MTNEAPTVGSPCVRQDLMIQCVAGMTISNVSPACSRRCASDVSPCKHATSLPGIPPRRPSAKRSSPRALSGEQGGAIDVLADTRLLSVAECCRVADNHERWYGSKPVGSQRREADRPGAWCWVPAAQMGICSAYSLLRRVRSPLTLPCVAHRAREVDAACAAP